MSTTIRSLLGRVRRVLDRNTGGDFSWVEDELLEHLDLGIRELWREIKELEDDYFHTVDSTNVTLAASTATLTGLPADIDTIHGITSRTPSTPPGFLFTPSRYKSVEFQRALTQSAIDPTGQTFYYAFAGAGGPVAAPTCHVAPMSTSAINLRVIYTPTLAATAITGNNPIPGESDAALVSWTLAWALAKTTKEKTPSAGYMQMFGDSRDKLLVSLTSRQIDEPRYVEALFQDEWD